MTVWLDVASKVPSSANNAAWAWPYPPLTALVFMSHNIHSLGTSAATRRLLSRLLATALCPTELATADGMKSASTASKVASVLTGAIERAQI